MATLTGNTIASTYTGLLSVTGAIGTTTLESVTDGAGTATSLSLSQQKAKIVLGTDSGDDFTINNGSADIVLVEGDTNDVTLLDDLIFISDSAVVKFGADGDTTLTHTDGTGLTLNSTNKLCFNDASQYIQGASATVLDIAATDEIELTATEVEINVTTLDVNGNADISGTLALNDDVTIIQGKKIIFDSADTYIYANTDNPEDLVLGADADIILEPDGSVSIGHTSPDSVLHVEGATTTSSQAICHIECTEASADSGDVLFWLDWSGDSAVDAASRWMDFHDSDGTIGRLESSGTQIDTAFTQESDIRYKNNIVDTSLKGLETLNKIKVRDFEWNEKYGASKAGIKVTAGFVADELYEVYPAATKGTPGAVHEDGSIKSMGVMEGAFTRLLIKAVQELSVSNDALKARIEVLEAA